MVGGADHTHAHEEIVTNEYYRNTDTNLRDEMMDEYAEKSSPPQKVPFYKKKKYWVICAIITVILTIVIVILALFVIFPSIAQSLMNKSNIEVTKAEIMFKKPAELDNTAYAKRFGDDLNTTFYMHMESALSNTGPFHATIKFLNPVNVYDEKGYLGDIFFFEGTEIAGGSGALNAYTPFIIRDNTAFTTFAQSMMAVEEFKWTLKGKLEITALSRTATVDLNKDIILKGMNGFPNVKITSFQLPGDAPGGGIALELGTMLESPSPIAVELGTIALQIGYDGIVLGRVTGENIVLQQGENNLLLKGVLSPPAAGDTVALEKIGILFSDYIAGKDSLTTAVGISCAPDGVNPVAWLSDAFKTVKLNVMLGNGAPLSIINGVSMGDLELKFNSANPYSPSVNAPLVNVGFQMPFGFSLSITEVTQAITLGLGTTKEDMVNFAKIDTPYTPAVSDQAAGKIELALNNAIIAGFSGQESVFNDYTYALTSGGDYTFMLDGTASTKTNTPLGPLILSGINFTVPTTLMGMNNFGGSAKVISTKVAGATAEYIIVELEVELSNPSALTVHVGDINFDVSVKQNDANVGRVYMDGLVITPGAAVYQGRMHLGGAGTDEPTVNHMLTGYLSGGSVELLIKGSAESTTIPSLNPALQDVTLLSSITGLPPQLVKFIDIDLDNEAVMVYTNEGIVTATVVLYNPLDVPFTLTRVQAQVKEMCHCGGCKGSEVIVGNVDQNFDEPLVVQPKMTANATLVVKAQANIDEMVFLMAFIDYKLYDLYQTVDNIVDGAYAVKDMAYNQMAVPYRMFLQGLSELIAFPGACEMLNGEPMSVSRTSIPSSNSAPGEIQEIINKLKGMQGGQPVIGETIPIAAPTAAEAPVAYEVPVVIPVF